MRVRQDGLTAREVDGTLMVLDLTTSQYFGIRGSGRVVYDALAEDVDVDDLVEAVTSEYAVDEAVARADVEAFVRKLDEAGLLVR